MQIICETEDVGLELSGSVGLLKRSLIKEEYQAALALRRAFFKLFSPSRIDGRVYHCLPFCLRDNHPWEPPPALLSSSSEGVG